MSINFLTSAFYNGFTVDFIDELRRCIDHGATFAYIASDFDGHDVTDKYFGYVIDDFNQCGFNFSEKMIIDSRVSIEKAKSLIESADVVWICGGDTLLQISDISRYELRSSLIARDGVTIGMSAGAINMAKRVVLAKDLNDNVPDLSIYEGLGLVDINIEPHLNSASSEHLNDIHQASEHAVIYGLYDDSFIKVDGREIKIVGKYRIFDIRPQML